MAAKSKNKSKKLPIDPEIFKLAVKNAYEHILITDPDGKILYANEGVSRITGYTHKEIMGGTPTLWGKQMDQKFYENFWKTIKSDKKPFIGEIKNRRKNGEVYNAQISVTPVLNSKKEISFFVGIERDVSDK